MPLAGVVAQNRIDQRDTIRLVSAAWTEQTVLSALGLPEQVLSDLAELDGVTDERMEAEQGHSAGISIQELVFGVPEAETINAAFCHPGQGGRFHGPERGAWYAGFDQTTAIDEVSFHRRRSLEDTRATGTFDLPHRLFLADFAGPFHHLTLRDLEYLAADPVPSCYADSQALARRLLRQGSAGIVYPSVRHPGGWAIACFRPALVSHVRRGELITLRIDI